MNKNLIIGVILLLLVIAGVLWFVMRGDLISVSITVKNDSGSPVENAKVSIEAESQSTDAQGSAVIPFRTKAGESIEVKAEWQGQSKSAQVRIEREDITERSAEVTIVLASGKPKMGWVKVLTPKLSGVSVSVNDVPRGEALVVADAPQGQPATIRATKEGFQSRDTMVAVNGDTLTWSVALEKAKPRKRHTGGGGPITPPPPKTGSLLIKSTPSGAKVSIDGVEQRETTPLTKKLEHGLHSVEATLNGKTEHKEVDLEKASDVVEFNLPTSRARSAKFMLKSVPPGAKIKVDGQELPQVTPATVDVSFGEHTVELSAGGKSMTQTVKIDIDYLVRTFVIGDCIEKVKQAEARMAEIATTKRESTYVEIDQILATCDSASVTVDMYRKALYIRGVANYNMRNFGPAIELFQKLATKYDKTNPLVYYYLGLTYEKSRKYFDAINAFNEIERHKTFIAPDRREEILGESVFSVGNDYYLLSTYTEDPDLKAQLQDAALQNLSEFISDYCSGNTKSHQRCDRANQIIHDLEK